MSKKAKPVLGGGGNVPYRCPICSSIIMFRLVQATISSISVQQVFPHLWKSERSDAGRISFTIPICATCETCGQTLPAPTSMAATALQPARRKCR